MEYVFCETSSFVLLQKIFQLDSCTWNAVTAHNLSTTLYDICNLAINFHHPHVFPIQCHCHMDSGNVFCNLYIDTGMHIIPWWLNHSYCSCDASKVRKICTMAYMDGRQLQHHWNESRKSCQWDDCSLEERTLFQYILSYSGILGQSLAQRQLGEQQQLFKEKYYHKSLFSWYAV